MKLIEYLEEKYGEAGPRIVTVLEARAFGIKYPLQSGWLEKHGGQEITHEIARTLAAKLQEKGMRSGNESKANYCLAGAAIMRRIAQGVK